MNKRNLAIGCGVVFVLLIVCGVIASLSGQSGQRAAAPTTSDQVAKPAEQPTKPVDKPVAAPKPTEPPKPTETPKPLPKVGETITAGNWEYTVEKLEKAKTLTWSQFGNKTDAKGTWLVVYMTLKNVGKENFSINTWDFELNDATGIKYNTTTDVATAYGFNDLKKLAKLGEQFPPGVSTKTALLFDIAPDAKGLKLLVKQAQTSIDLGQ